MLPAVQNKCVYCMFVFLYALSYCSVTLILRNHSIDFIRFFRRFSVSLHSLQKQNELWKVLRI